MATPTNKDELLRAIADDYAKLAAELATIPAERTGTKELDGHAKGTSMSVRDLVAYLVGWGRLVLKWHDRRTRGLAVDFPETGFKWNELGRLAQKFYADHAQHDFRTLTAELEKTTNKIVRLVKSMSNEELYETAWYDRWTLGKLIQLNTSSPFKNAKARLRKWKRANGLG